MLQIEDQEVTIGGESLIYSLGDPINIYNETVKVKVNGGFADIFIQLDTYFNRFVVDQDKLHPDYAGSYKIDVIATWPGPDKIERLVTSFILKVKP